MKGVKFSIGIWVFPYMVVPQNGLFRLKNLIKMDDLGVPLFSETSMCTCYHAFIKNIIVVPFNISTIRFIGDSWTWHLCFKENTHRTSSRPRGHLGFPSLVSQRLVQLIAWFVSNTQCMVYLPTFVHLFHLQTDFIIPQMLNVGNTFTYIWSRKNSHKMHVGKLIYHLSNGMVWVLNSTGWGGLPSSIDDSK